MIENLPATEATVIETKNRLVRRYPALREPINGYMRSALADDRLADRRAASSSASGSASASRKPSSPLRPKAPRSRRVRWPSTTTARISCC